MQLRGLKSRQKSKLGLLHRHKLYRKPQKQLQRQRQMLSHRHKPYRKPQKQLQRQRQMLLQWQLQLSDKFDSLSETEL